MNPLPDPAIGGGNIPISQSDQSDQLNQSGQSKTDDASRLGGGGVSAGGAGIAKEVELGGLPPSEQLRPATPEIEVPKEVTGAGVTIQPTTVALPPNVAGMGVQPAGANVPATPSDSPAANLPLSEEQIAKGLHESVMSSWRWLAEWCVRKIKQIHSKILGSGKR